MDAGAQLWSELGFLAARGVADPRVGMAPAAVVERVDILELVEQVHQLLLVEME